LWNNNTPSATIYRNSDTGHWLLHCHSSHCDFETGSIIDVTMRQRRLSFKEAVEYLMNYYQISYDPKVWKEEYEAILDENIRIIQDQVKLKEQYPYLYKLIHRVQDDLISKLNVAKECLVSDKLVQKDRVIFFCSLREFLRRKLNLSTQPKYSDNQKKRIDRYCLLNLMEKLSNQEIPTEIHAKAKSQQNNKHHEYRVQFYRISRYTPELLKQADDIAKMIKEKKFRLNGISRLLICEHFGEETAQRVYPQSRKSYEELKDNDFIRMLEDVLATEILDHDFTTYTKLYEAMHSHYSWVSVTQERISTHLPGLLIKYGLVEVHSNKELKDLYGIQVSGYPKIIIRENEKKDCVKIFGEEKKKRDV
jgi:hypothetical protein